MNNLCTVEPALRLPRLYHHLLLRPFSFDPNIKISDSFYYFEDPANETTSLLRPGIKAQR